MIEYGFIENVDYLVTDIFIPNSNGGRQTQKDYIISLDMAKHIELKNKILILFLKLYINMCRKCLE